MAGSSPDDRLIELGNQFDKLGKVIDERMAADSYRNIDKDSEWQEIRKVYEEIISTPAKTFDGLRVKARVYAFWQDDVDIDLDYVRVPGEKAIGTRVAESILRDLLTV
jgi:hypothetical protein